MVTYTFLVPATYFLQDDLMINEQNEVKECVL
jgi:hypothetical protein